MLFWRILLLFTPWMVYSGLDGYAPLYSITPYSVKSTSQSLALIVPEICDNGIDDDLDGFVDAFDTDCPCSLTSYQAYCPVDCEYLPDSFPDISLSLKWQSEIIVNEFHVYPNIVVGDMNHDGIIDVVAKKYITSGFGNNFTNGMAVFNGKTGTKLKEFNSIPRNINGEGFWTSIADVDNDGTAEFFVARLDTLICIRYDGTILWKSDRLNTDMGYTINIADFNGDGIPEVYRGNTIVNARTGKLLVTGNAGKGCNLYEVEGDCYITHSIAADLLPSPGLELAAGNTVYQVNITNTNGTAGNSMTAVNANSPVKDGLTSVGDIDGDGQLDVIVVRSKDYNNGGGVWVWNPRTRNVIASGTAGTTGGMAFIGNVAGDCKPEIGVNFEDQLKMFSYNGTTTLQVLYNLPTSDNSGHTGVTMFDFNQDGLNELVYRDEDLLRIMNGRTGTNLTTYPIKSGTGMEYPVVADVDGDGEAEIIVSGYTTTTSQQRLYCFESGGTPWAPARSVWNQPGYHVTNVNDDLTIPRHEQNQATALIGYETCLQPTCPAPYNSFMAQATFRTQQGCVQFPAADLTLDILDVACADDSLEICFVIANAGDKVIPAQAVAVSLWPSNPLHSSAAPLETKQLFLTAALNKPDTFCFSFAASSLPPRLFMAVNDPGTVPSPYAFPLTDLVECIYANNLDSLTLGAILLPVNLGPDTTICPGEMLPFHYAGDYTWINWLPSSAVDCDTCRTVHFISPQSATLMVAVGNGSCTGYDTITINIIQPVLIETDTSFCEGTTINYKDSTIVSGGDYQFQVGLCDSTYILHVTVFEVDTVYKTVMICDNDSIFFNGNWIKNSGVYSNLGTNRFGCDSLTILNLLVEDHISKEQELFLCPGDSVRVRQSWISTPGYYADTIPGITCDTIAGTTVTQAQVYQEEIEIALCPDDSVFLNGQWIKTNQTIVLTLSSIHGCDSTIIHHVTMLAKPIAPDLSVDCAEGNFLASGHADPSWAYEWDNGSTETITMYEVPGPAFLRLYHPPDCEVRYDFEVPAVPKPNALVSLHDTTLLEKHPLMIALGLNPDEWSVLWTPEAISSCPACMSTTLSPATNTTVHVQLVHNSGCVYETDFDITLEAVVDLYIPNVFSPNGDQVNDTWTIINPDLKLEIVKATIFDRWGNQLQEWDHTNDIAWDGMFKGKPMNPGVFAFSVEYLDQENKKQVKTGNITLLR